MQNSVEKCISQTRERMNSGKSGTSVGHVRVQPRGRDYAGAEKIADRNDDPLSDVTAGHLHASLSPTKFVSLFERQLFRQLDLLLNVYSLKTFTFHFNTNRQSRY